MGQVDIINFLNENKGKEFTSLELYERVQVCSYANLCRSLRALKKFKEVEHGVKMKKIDRNRLVQVDYYWVER